MSRTGLSLTAGRALSLTVGATTFGRTRPRHSRVAPEARAAADDQNNGDRGARLGSGNDIAERGIDIGAGSKLTGGTVNLFASVVKMEMDSQRQSEAYAAFYAQAYANSYVDVYTDTYVRVHGPDTTISGINGVDIRALSGSAQVTPQDPPG